MIGGNQSDYVSDSCLSDEIDYIQPITNDLSNSKIEQDYIVTSTSNNRVSHKNESVSHKSNVRLQASSNNKRIRVWDKIHFCLYCGKSSTNITKYLLGQHKEEDDIKEINRHQEKSKQRKLLILKLRNAGDYKHNMEVIQSGSGTLVTWDKKSNNFFS